MTIQEIIDQLRHSDFLLQCNIMMGYAPALPMLTKKAGKTLLVVPLMRHHVVGVVDQTRVFAPRYVVTLDAATGQVASYADLTYDERFASIDFSQPVGLFRHPAIRHMGKTEYTRQRARLLQLLDQLSLSLQGKATLSGADAQQLDQLYAQLLEPSVKPFYHAICPDFFEKHLAE